MAFQTQIPTILVVDDEPKVIFFINNIFTRRGYQVLTATSGDAAVQILDDIAEDIHLLLLDLKMPGLSGTEVLKIVKSKYPKLPVGILTAYGDKEEECRLLGADFFVKKPYSLRELNDSIEEAVKKSPKTEEPAVEIKPGYVPCAKILVVDDENDICACLKEELEGGIELALGDYQVEVAYDGREGIKKAREIEPDLIIVDIKMPHMRGDQMINILEQEGPRPKDYIILTAVDAAEEKRKIRRGRRPLVDKPFDMSKFCENLRELCFKHGLIKKL